MGGFAIGTTEFVTMGLLPEMAEGVHVSIPAAGHVNSAYGAFFGVASLVAAGMVAPALRGRAVSLVMLGLPVANVLGVPAATWMGQNLGWRSAYVAVTLIALVTAALVLALVPATLADREATGRKELRASRRHRCGSRWRSASGVCWAPSPAVTSPTGRSSVP